MLFKKKQQCCNGLASRQRELSKKPLILACEEVHTCWLFFFWLKKKKTYQVSEQAQLSDCGGELPHATARYQQLTV